MPNWTLFGLAHGTATTDWPAAGPDAGQEGVLGMPRFAPEKCQSGCRECVEVCVTQALSIHPDDPARLNLDYGRCIACQLCVEACPTEALTASGNWAYAVRERADLHWQQALHTTEAKQLRNAVSRTFRSSLHIRHVDAGSCNGCESELQALNNPFYNLHRLGIFFTASPRFADLLLVTGSVTYAMREPLLAAYEAMAEPRWVLAAGTCAVSGGVAAGGYSSGQGLEGLLPVDVWLPGCPPNPAALIHALLVLLERAPPKVKGGRHE
ncbi:MAG: NADH-quinone oxidoreductase subunit NuoB [Gammaproteobacteria bacterium]|nr:NADH-quinone oxidoreductase subunit NuoB [Gammaproteobacteria bacterium]MDE2344941.1 NADH-quinone oxidoreductase subunit NuoB [Gammaproteobacteria bacterium]